MLHSLTKCTNSRPGNILRPTRPTFVIAVLSEEARMASSSLPDAFPKRHHTLMVGERTVLESPTLGSRDGKAAVCGRMCVLPSVVTLYGVSAVTPGDDWVQSSLPAVRLAAARLILMYLIADVSPLQDKRKHISD